MSSRPWATVVILLLISQGGIPAQSSGDFVPVTDAMLQDPAPADWLMWRRTLDSWGYSPLEQIDRENVGELRMVWSRALAPGSQQGTPLVYDGVLYMPNPRDVIQAMEAATGDLIWEYRRQRQGRRARRRWKPRPRRCRRHSPGAVAFYAAMGRSIAESVTEHDSEEATPPHHGQVGRNDPCPCGSGKKYKRCCGTTVH